MPVAAKGMAKGATLELAQGWTGKIRDISESGIAQYEAHDVTAHDDAEPDRSAGEQGGFVFDIDKIGDPGQMTLEVYVDENDLPETGLMEQWTIKDRTRTGQATPAQWQGDAAIINMDIVRPVKGPKYATLTVQKSGVWVPTAATDV